MIIGNMQDLHYYKGSMYFLKQAVHKHLKISKLLYLMDLMSFGDPTITITIKLGSIINSLKTINIFIGIVGLVELQTG
jgi:hypothetical protein